MAFETNIRPAAKIILASPEGIVLRQGETGRINLPGGGMDEGENPIDTVIRELFEETGLSVANLEGLTWRGRVSDTVSSREGQQFTADWHVFSASTRTLPEFMTGDGAVLSMSEQDLLRHVQVTNLAKRAIWELSPAKIR